MSEFKNHSNFLTFIYGQLIVTKKILTIKAFYCDLYISFCQTKNTRIYFIKRWKELKEKFYFAMDVSQIIMLVMDLLYEI